MLSSCWWATRRTWLTRGRCEAASCRVLAGPAHAPLLCSFSWRRSSGMRGWCEPVLPTCPHAAEKGPWGHWSIESTWQTLALSGSARKPHLPLPAGALLCERSVWSPVRPAPHSGTWAGAQPWPQCGCRWQSLGPPLASASASALCLCPHETPVPCEGSDLGCERAELPVRSCACSAQTGLTYVPPASVHPLISWDLAWSNRAKGPGLLASSSVL